VTGGARKEEEEAATRVRMEEAAMQAKVDKAATTLDSSVHDRCALRQGTRGRIPTPSTEEAAGATRWGRKRQQWDARRG
jgi:hypothetical protein